MVLAHENSRLGQLLHWFAQHQCDMPILGRAVLFLLQYVLITQPPALLPLPEKELTDMTRREQLPKFHCLRV